MKKLKLLLVILMFAFISNAQFTTDTVQVINPQNNLKEVVGGKYLTIYFGDFNTDSLAKGVISIVDNTAWIKDTYFIYTKGIGDTTFISQGQNTYYTKDIDKLNQWKSLINSMVVPAKYSSDSLDYFNKGYKTERKPFN